MNQKSLKSEQFKEVLKEAIRELIVEDRAMFSDLIAEVIEDVALVNAIKEGEATEAVSREAIFKSYFL